MTTKKKEQAKVVSQEQLADGIFSMWIQTEAAGSARPGQFISMYTNDGSKLLPRPISICEIDKEGGKLRVVYRVTGEKTGTEEFSQMKAGDTIPVIGPLGNGFPFEKAEGKKVYTPDVNAFRTFAQKRYVEKYGRDWPSGAMERINAL